MMKKKKGLALQYYFLIIAFLLGLGTFYVSTLKYVFPGYVGESAIHLQDARSQSYDIIHFLDVSSGISAYDASYTLGKRGGGAECGDYLGYALWTSEGAASCAPTLQRAALAFSSDYLFRLDEFLLLYQSYTSAIIPSNNFEISSEAQGIATIQQKNPILIPIGKGLDIRPKEEPGILQNIGLTKQLPTPSSPLLPSPQPSSGFPTLSAEQVDALFLKRKSPLTGIGQLFSATEQRTQVPSSVLLAISSTESGLRHCCYSTTKTSGTTCQPIAAPSCGKNLILTSPSGSVGLMQINVKVNSALADKVCRSDETVYDLECNINIGAKLLRDSHLRYQNGIPESLLRKYCKDEQQVQKYLSYRGWEAAMRAYNGLGCDSNRGADTSYVENVQKRFAEITTLPSTALT